ncbi:hypothetical protein OIU74_021502 [Salix koriyanagi]|uniref:Tyrosine specific protein phosphatases domain-containing protein n=1 Tax=Salix koriyanagi TaxID=2511006 RepID=A0A9Q0WJP4_9ROSI|nr:hypothetical protein OIU74_021502 [Salix koriyanagi]
MQGFIVAREQWQKKQRPYNGISSVGDQIKKVDVQGYSLRRTRELSPLSLQELKDILFFSLPVIEDGCRLINLDGVTSNSAVPHLFFSPYLYFVRIFSFLRRFTSGEEPYNEICEGVYVGGLPYSVDKLPPGNPAIIDCTCEFPRKEEFKGHSYLCLPTWDTRAPQPGEIESAVKWAIRKRAQNVPVYIHCAYGHGRSVAVMCALLVALGVVEDWKKAEQLISERRPYISMNSDHYKALEEWSKHRLSTPTINEVNSSSAVPSTSSGRSRADRPKNRSG